MQMLKLRGSVGYTGNAQFDPYQAITTYKYDSELNYYKGIGAVPILIGNTDLKWERTMNWNAGLDVELFNRRIEMTFDIYRRITDNLLLDVTIAPSIGQSKAKMNVGEQLNTGFEIDTRFNVIRNNDWMWSVALSASSNKNKILKISNALRELNETNNKEENLANVVPLYEEGESISAIKAVQSGGIDPLTGREIYIDRFGKQTFVYDYLDKRVYGDSDPDIEGYIKSFLTYKGLSLNLIFQYSSGVTIYNSTLATRVEGTNWRYNADRRVLTSRWKEPGDVVKYKDIADGTLTKMTSRFVADENFFRLSSLTLAYDVPAQFYEKLSLKRLRLEFKMNDVFRISTIQRERGLAYPFAWSYSSIRGCAINYISIMPAGIIFTSTIIR